MSQKQKNDYSSEPLWYVVHTYSGYENKVKTDLEKTLQNREEELNCLSPQHKQKQSAESKQTRN